MNKFREFRLQTRLMGSAFEFVILSGEQKGQFLLEDSINEVKRIEALLTEFSVHSQTSLINQFAGIQPVRVDPEVYDIIQRCKAISTLTQGAFDITASLLKKMYNFKGQKFDMPEEGQIRKALSKVGNDKIQLQKDNHVFLTEPGMHIGFGAIGKGYAADCVKKMLISKGVQSAVINASGDLTAWGCHLDGSPWKVGIADPLDPAKALLWIPVRNSSVATSGDYEQYFELNGERFSHTLDPKTGKPVKGIKSVTVISASAELSDALATAIFIMGPEAGLYFVEQLPDTHAIVIDDSNEVSMSKHFKLSAHESVQA